MQPPVFGLDIRTIHPRDRHALIFSTFERLAPGQSLEILNDHDPAPLQHQFHDRLPGQFSWTPVQSGPAAWRVRIERVQAGATAAHGAGSCCGGCGGA